MKYVIVNGDIIQKEEANLTSFIWEDQFIIKEKIWFGFGGIPLLRESLEQLVIHAQCLGVDIPSLFLDQRELFRRIKRMLNKNRFYRTGIINIQILISVSETDFIVFATPFEEMEFKYHEKGVLIEVAKDHKYSGTPLPLTDNNRLIYTRLEKVRNRDTFIQNFIFLNEKGMVCDAGNANVFFIKKNALITPSLVAGCFPDRLRKYILEAANNLKLEVIETDEIIPETIYKMDEIFFAGEATGIQWVLGIETKRFVHPVSAQIQNELNTILESKVINYR